MKPLISVVVTVYNGKDYIESCLTCIFGQTYGNLEILVVDDGSYDGSRELCKSMVEKDVRMKLYCTPHGGVSRARNMALAEVKGEYLVFINIDDKIDLNFVEVLYDMTVANNAEIAVCKVCYTGDGWKERKGRSDAGDRIFDRKEAMKELVAEELILSTMTMKVIKKELLEGIELPVGRMYEDLFTVYKLFHKAEKIVYTDKTRYYYYYKEDSICNRTLTKGSVDLYFANRQLLNFVKIHYPELVKPMELKCVKVAVFLLIRMMNDCFFNAALERELLIEVKGNLSVFLFSSNRLKNKLFAIAAALHFTAFRRLFMALHMPDEKSIRPKVAIITEADIAEDAMDAGSKIRTDMNSGLVAAGFQTLSVSSWDAEDKKNYKFKYMTAKLKEFIKWADNLLLFPAGSFVVFQLPLGHVKKYYHFITGTMKKWKKTESICVIYDMDTIPNEDIFSEERTEDINRCDYLVVHNEVWKTICMKRGIPEEKITCIHLFDYCMPKRYGIPIRDFSSKVVIAGNLDRKHSGYIRYLPQDKLTYHLYGDGYDSKSCHNICYHGSFSPKELPAHLHGSFGLIWNGDDINACVGTAEYPQYDNSYTASYYLASGLPVILWNQDPLAEFILENKLGFAVESILSLEKTIAGITREEYVDIGRNVRILGKRLAGGRYFRDMLGHILERGQKKGFLPSFVDEDMDI